MNIPGVKTAKKVSRWLRARILGGALILGYHRISATEEDVYEVCVSPENFAGHMRALKQYSHPISLSKLLQSLKQNALPPRSVAVTFDDGYADNLYVAKPILEKYEIPATVFICTGFMGTEFWWDELAHLVISSRADPRVLRFRSGAVPFTWKTPQVSLDVENLEIRRQFRRALYHYILSLDVEDQNHALDAIRKWSGLSPKEPCAARTLNEAELLQLAAGGLIEIGAHSHHHLMLPKLSVERQKEEIEINKRELERLLGIPTAGFSYPNGRTNEQIKRIVRESGFVYACTSQQDVVRPGNDIYEMTRFWQQDVDGDRFARRLKSWLSMQVLR